MNKIVADATAALSGVGDGMTILVGGWGSLGIPVDLLAALLDSGAKDLVLVHTGTKTLYDLIAAGRVRKVITSFASYAATRDPSPFDALYLQGKLELDLTSQGTLAERIRAGGAGIPAFYCRVTAGTQLAQGKPTAVFGGVEYVLEYAIHADFALIAAECADRFGNLTYRLSDRNFNDPMATAADIVVAEVSRLVELGAIEPDNVGTPGAYVDRVVLGGAR